MIKGDHLKGGNMKQLESNELNNIREVIELSPDSVMEMCRKYNMYTLGSNEEYGEMLNYVKERSSNLSRIELLTICNDIATVSNWENDILSRYEVAAENRMYIIYNILLQNYCYVHYELKK